MTEEDQDSLSARLKLILDEHRQISASYDGSCLERFVQALIEANRVFFSGQGRSGLMSRAIAIRLMHIGLNVHVAGESSTPAISHGDVLVAVSASARTQATLMHMKTARSAGAKVALVSAVVSQSDLADFVLPIPARTAVPSKQHAGSLFEQSWLILGDLIAWRVQQRLGVPEEVLNARHANLQ